MKAAGQKLKKIKTRCVYGFKKDQFGIGGIGGDPTTQTSVMTTSIHVFSYKLN
jgi:hypothetical protein